MSARMNRNVKLAGGLLSGTATVMGARSAHKHHKMQQNQPHLRDAATSDRNAEMASAGLTGLATPLFLRNAYKAHQEIDDEGADEDRTGL